ncbi:MAG: PIN domain nuclease of toxin-antitoxin system [Myxococcota bacterium]
MEYLLDTHTFLWMRHTPQRLGPAVSAICADPDSKLSLSLVSAWEIAIKLSIGKLRLPQPLAQILADARTHRGIATLPIEEKHVLRVEHLPFHHRDPFDRLLAAQALEDGLIFLSADTTFDAYAVKRVW